MLGSSCLFLARSLNLVHGIAFRQSFIYRQSTLHSDFTVFLLFLLDFWDVGVAGFVGKGSIVFVVLFRQWL
jgi:hypothetical protein